MEQFSNAEACVSAALSVLTSNGELEAAAKLRGIEMFTREDVELTLGELRLVRPSDPASQNAVKAAIGACLSALMQGNKSPAAA